MKISNKNEETALDDGASIYTKRDNKTEKEKLKNMNFKERLQYLKDYYFKIGALTLCVAAVAVLLIYDVWRSNQIKSGLYIAVINYPFEDSISSQIENEFGSYVNLGKNKTINFDDSYSFSNYDYSSEEKFNIYIASGELDIVIAPSSVFKKYASRGFIASLTDNLPTELYSSLASNFFVCNTVSSDTENTDNATGPADIYGIYVDTCYPFNNLSYDERERPVIGILVSSKKIETSVAFIRYMFHRDYILEKFKLSVN